MKDFVAVALDAAGNVKAFTTGTENASKAAAKVYRRKENGLRVYPIIKVMTTEKWETMSKEELQVIFRKEKDGNIIAFFPGIRIFPYGKLIVSDGKIERLVTMKEDSNGSYITFNRKRYRIRNNGNLYSPCLQVVNY